jgi:hypothetical protein
LRREISFYSGKPTFNKQGYSEQMFISVGNPNDMICGIATAFGGNLVFDRMLRFEDRKLVTHTWIDPLADPDARLYGYFTDINATYIASEALCRGSRWCFESYRGIVCFTYRILSRLLYHRNVGTCAYVTRAASSQACSGSA